MKVERNYKRKVVKIDALLQTNNKNEYIGIRMLDISKGGLCFNSRTKLTIKNNQRVKVIAGSSKLEGILRWEKRSNSGYIYGLKFTE